MSKMLKDLTEITTKKSSVSLGVLKDFYDMDYVTGISTGEAKAPCIKLFNSEQSALKLDIFFSKSFKGDLNSETNVMRISTEKDGTVIPAPYHVLTNNSGEAAEADKDTVMALVEARTARYSKE